jgi:hypothetical protein
MTVPTSSLDNLACSIKRTDIKTHGLRIVGAIGLFCLCLSVPLRISASEETGTEQVAASGQKLEFQGDGRTFQISGSNNEITISGECRKLQVAGHDNRIKLDVVGSIELAGYGNHVSFRQGSNGKRPATSTLGRDNKIVHISAASESAPGESATPEPSISAEHSASPAKNIEGTVILKGSNQNVDRTMRGEPVEVEGNNNRIALSGAVETLSVSGSNNIISVDSIRKVVFTGSNNILSYHGTAPQVEDRAANNVLRSQ